MTKQEKTELYEEVKESLKLPNGDYPLYILINLAYAERLRLLKENE